jgi:hypothetical protein
MSRLWHWCLLAVCLSCVLDASAFSQDDSTTVRVFIFAGQSNMVGADSKVSDIDRFPPFVGLGEPQSDVRFWYCIGRENKTTSAGWVSLQPVRQMVGPELSFAREVTRHTAAPVAIIKIAAGGTHLGGDWNPDQPMGFKLYPLALQQVEEALAELKQQQLPYRVEGFMWHQGENDMFNEQYMSNYGDNLRNFIASWRRDLQQPDLRFYIGELCTKTIWGMDLRPRMYAISVGQKQVTDNDPLAQYVPTSHVGVEIGGGVGLHYHYGTLGQLEHGVNYADAYLRNIGKTDSTKRTLDRWPYPVGSKVKLFVLAGHRNMEGERAFVQHLQTLPGAAGLRDDVPGVVFKYSLGGGYRESDGWEPLGPAGCYDTFGPELSFAAELQDHGVENFAVAKFTHSGSQVIDWTPAGSVAESRNLYPAFIQFVRDAIRELEQQQVEVELRGIFYHLGENDMSWGPFRRQAPQRLMSLITQSRIDLGLPNLRWYVSQQPPTDDERVNDIDVTTEVERLIAFDPQVVHVKAFDMPPQAEKLVMDTRAVVWLGRLLARQFVEHP